MGIIRSFPIINHSSSTVRIILEQKNFSKKSYLYRDWTWDPRTLVALVLKWHAFPTELPWQVLIDGYLTPLLFVYQLTFGLKRIQLKLIEHDYIRIFKVSVFQSMRISTVGKAWNCNRRATSVLGCQVWSQLEVTFLLNLFCSKTRMIYFSETSIALKFGHKLLIMNHITVM